MVARGRDNMRPKIEAQGMDARATRRIRSTRCRGTVEDHQKIALDARELTTLRVFERPVGSVFPLTLRYPWLRSLRLDAFGLVLQLATGRTVTVRWTWTRRSALGNRPLLLCPSCGNRACFLYHLAGQVICRTCGGLWYAAQRRSANARRVLRAQRLRLKLDREQRLPSLDNLDAFPPRPRGMHRRTYDLLRRRDELIRRRLNWSYWRDPDWPALARR
jgi:hypothetical protein